ncbi:MULTISPECIES: LysR substrate-binding domain-containing protein [unclassified Inquilinus]|uniref:LysR substrate-binding domain-containing protein n=1 Tax=unclassified Inquilinus TaxID=2645927 RepID=UPI003F9144F8
MDRLTSIGIYVRVAEAGSFAAAADAFGLSATMVANHVRALEDRLGARLIERTTRRHHLTEIGTAYLERCRDVLASAEAADRVAESLRAVPQGTLRVTAPVTWGAHRLVPAIGAYMELYPAVRVELGLNDRLVDLAEEGFDIGIRSGRVGDEGLVARPLAPSRLHAVASPAYLARRGTPLHPAELEGHDLLAFAAWGPDHAWRFSRGAETAAVPVRGRMVCNNGQALLTAVLAGMGVVVQADVLLDPAIADGRLVRLLPDWDLPARAIHLVRRHEPRPSAKLRSFVNFLVERLGDVPLGRGPGSGDAQA